MVKTSYRKLALKYHPDRNPTPEGRDMFEKIKIASEVLLNADLRRKYDDIEKAKRERDLNL
jgi:DnaJ-class molecular chaperone